MNRKVLFLLLSITILAICPFYWFKPGEVNLGGDSSRLYFYAPLLFIKNYVFYGVNPWNTGSEMISYFFIPFSLLLQSALFFVKTPHNLINLFNSFSLVAAFVGTYLSISSIILDMGTREKKNKFLATISGVIGGLFYVFAPMMTSWDKPLVTFNNIFLNPILFFLLYKFVNTRKSIYILITIVISFIFAPNFSFIGAPTFFSFFPFVLVYLVLFNLIIKKNHFDIRKLILFVVLFIGIQAFHLLPQLSMMTDPSTNAVQRVFGSGGSNEGNNYFAYFTSIASNVFLTPNILGSTQNHDIFNIFNILFPLLIVFSLLAQPLQEETILKKQNIIFTFLLLICMFFVTGHLTVLGFSLYKSLFAIPGFGMFRNFYGQFATTFFFFYALSVGLSFYIFVNRKRILMGVAVTSLIILLLLIRGIPLLTGAMVHQTVLQARNNVSVPFVVPPSFEKLLAHITSEKTDEKILTLPLTDFAYQMMGGEHGGLYIGPSFIGGLTLKKDYTGYQAMGGVGDAFIEAAKNNNKQVVENALSLLNIHEIVWDKDPTIYEDNFPLFPYQTTQGYIETKVPAYEKLLSNLDIEKVKSFGKYFKLFTLSNSIMLPKIFATNTVVISDTPEDSPYLLIRTNAVPNITLPSTIYPTQIKNVSFEANLEHPLNDLNYNFQFHNAEPTSQQEPGTPWYPLIAWKEDRSLKKSQGQDKMINTFLDLAKRIAEINRWGDRLLISGHPMTPLHFSVKDFMVWSRYGSLESVFSHYEGIATDYVNSINSSSISDVITEKISTQEQFEQHRLRIDNAINSLEIEDQRKEYLHRLNNEMFDRLEEKLHVEPLDITYRKYTLSIPPEALGNYTLSLSHISDGASYPNLEIQGKEYTQTNQQDGKLSFGQIDIKTTGQLSILLHENPKNLSSGSSWEGFGTYTSTNGIDTLSVKNPNDDFSSGLVKQIPLVPEGNQYILSFYYKTNGNPFTIDLLDKRITDQGLRKTHTYSSRLLRSNDWQLYQTVFTIDPKTISAFIQIQNALPEKISEILIKDLSITVVDNPILTLEKQDTTNSQLPYISFKRINPTKYKISVNNASSPYFLTFLEGYSKNWKIYLSGDTAKNTFLTDKSYFNGLVKEGGHENTLIDKYTFETFNKRPIAEKSHMSAYGYANAWIISPGDVKNKSNYTLIVELQSQSKFYVGSIVTIVSLLVTVILLITVVFLEIRESLPKLLH